MKVIELISENFKRLNARVVMNGQSVTVEGKNGVGKSSFIDAVWVALTGKDVPAQPIQQGKDTAKLSVMVKSDDGTEFIVERKFTAAGAALTVKTKEGAKFSSPQTFLDNKLGRISFDPFDFVKKPPREQKKFLMELLGIDLAPFDEKKRTLLADHSMLQKKYTNEVATAGTFAPYDETLQEKSTAEAIARFNDVNNTRKKIEARKNLSLSLENQISSLQGLMKSLRAQYETAKAECAEKKEIFSKLLELGFDMPEVGDLQAEIDEINAHNERVKLNKRVRETLDNIANTQKLLNQKVSEIKQLEQKRIDTIAKAKMPIEGLSFSDDALLFEGLPLSEEQLSTSKLIEIGLRISMALNPTLRIMRVKDGSLLDSETLDVIRQAARDNDYQLFVERVSDSKEIGFVIEE